MCYTMRERYPVTLQWVEEYHSDEVYDRRVLDGIAPPPVERVAIAEGVTVIAMRPLACASTIVVVAERDVSADGRAVQEASFASHFRHGTTVYRKRALADYGWHPQSPFGPRAYPWT